MLSRVHNVWLAFAMHLNSIWSRMHQPWGRQVQLLQPWGRQVQLWGRRALRGQVFSCFKRIKNGKNYLTFRMPMSSYGGEHTSKGLPHSTHSYGSGATKNGKGSAMVPMAHAGSCWWDPVGHYVWSPILLVAQLPHLHGTLHASCEMHNMCDILY